jgi:putative Mg2+ transporter-C (MgtC) family protein
LRLVLAAFLGGAIGLEREVRHKPAGLRTNLFICVGAALFTILSDRLAAGFGGDHTRIAAQIIPGIGFIGAGSILHSRGSVSGLTTAATIFVVASIGMAVGGGLYVTAILAAIVVAIALNALLWFETRFNLKPITADFEVTGADADAVLADINQVLDDERQAMKTVHIARHDGGSKVRFQVEGTRRECRDILDKLRKTASTKNVQLSHGELIE